MVSTEIMLLYEINMKLIVNIIIMIFFNEKVIRFKPIRPILKSFFVSTFSATNTIKKYTNGFLGLPYDKPFPSDVRVVKGKHL